MARTFPTAGVSPIDGYVTTEVPVAYFRHELEDTLDAAVKTVEVITNVNVVAGGMPQGINSTMTLGASSYRGATACAGYFKVDMGTVSNSVSGRTSVLEARLEHNATTGTLPGYTTCLCLDFSNDLVGYPIASGCSYIALRERSAAAQQMNTLFDFMDITPATTDSTKIFTTDSSPGSQTHALRMLASGTVYWIMVTTHTPA